MLQFPSVLSYSVVLPLIFFLLLSHHILYIIQQLHNLHKTYLFLWRFSGSSHLFLVNNIYFFNFSQHLILSVQRWFSPVPSLCNIVFTSCQQNFKISIFSSHNSFCTLQYSLINNLVISYICISSVPALPFLFRDKWQFPDFFIPNALLNHSHRSRHWDHFSQDTHLLGAGFAPATYSHEIPSKHVKL